MAELEKKFKDCPECGWKMENSSTTRGKWVHDNGQKDCPRQICERCGLKYEELSMKGRDAHEAKCSELEIFDNPILAPKRFGFDFDGDCAFHGTYIGNNDGNPEPILIRSDRKFVRQAFFAEKNLKFAGFPPATGHFHLYGWQREAIKQWVIRGKTEEVRRLYLKVRTYLKKYVYHPDSMFHDAVACYILATHVWISFDAFPRLLITAKPDSGKSQLVRAIRNLCFKPTTTGDATKAALFRLASDTAGVFIFDNFDRLPDEQKSDVMHFIEISYQNDLPIFRVEEGPKKGGKVPTGFNVGVPLVAATTDLSSFSHAALTRSIVLVMEHCDEKIHELPDGKPSEDSNSLRQELYAWGLSSAPALKKEAMEFDCEFRARQAQIARPILFIASFIGENLSEKMKAWLVSNFESFHSEQEFDEKVQVVRALYECVKGRRELEIKVSVKEVAELLLAIQGVEKTDYQGKPNPRYAGFLNGKGQFVSEQLADIALSKKKPMRGITYYIFQRDTLFRHFARYGLLSDDEAQSILPSTPSTPPTPSPPSTPSTPSKTSKNSLTLYTASEVDVEGVGGVEGKGGMVKVRILKNVPAWRGPNKSNYGPFKAGQKVNLPAGEVAFLIKNKLAKLVEEGK